MDHHLLEKYFKGDCTAEEQARVEAWLNESDALPYVPADQADQISAERVAAGLEDRIINYQKKRSGRRWQMAIAASLLLSSAVAICFIQLKERHQKEAFAWKTTTIPMGQKAKIMLADGSLIELNGGAVLSYPEHFTTQRTVKLLQGDAFFSIARDEKRPFIVEMDNQSHIKVLGTRFNVKHNNYASRLEITLNSGRISFERKGKPGQLLLPGEQLHYSPVSDVASKPIHIDTLETDAWRTNILLFKDTPIRQVFNELEQHYGISFKNPEVVDYQLINARFNHEPLSKVLDLLERSTKLSFNQKGKTIYIHP